MVSPKEILVNIWYGDSTDISIREWVFDYIEQNENVPEEIFEIFDADSTSQEALLMKIVAISDSEFDSQCVQAEVMAAKLLLKVASDYLVGNVKPSDVCAVINNIDCGFLGAPRGLPDKIAYYPKWLGNLYHSCDWCDGGWTQSNAPHLKQDLQEQITVIQTWLEKS